jgi:hypothetical protein
MVKSVVIYESDLSQMRIKANSLCNLFSIIKDYSNKMFAQMQIISHLINDLIESEDSIIIKHTKLQSKFHNENESQN